MIPDNRDIQMAHEALQMLGCCWLVMFLTAVIYAVSTWF